MCFCRFESPPRYLQLQQELDEILMINLIEESMELELNVSELYQLFHNHLPDDAPFWWELVTEERNHAELIRQGKEHYEPNGKFPETLLSSKLPELKRANKELAVLISEVKGNPLSRKDSFNTALKLEISAGEIHFQEFMSSDTTATIQEEIFRELNSADKDHAERILKYMNENSIACSIYHELTQADEQSRALMG